MGIKERERQFHNGELPPPLPVGGWCARRPRLPILGPEWVLKGGNMGVKGGGDTIIYNNFSNLTDRCAVGPGGRERENLAPGLRHADRVLELGRQ
jgi:hypothetical protein